MNKQHEIPNKLDERFQNTNANRDMLEKGAIL